MTLRTARRRISPRTKSRYRAIREFFRRALGSPSQQDIKINSSIAVNVTDITRKIVSLEQQLEEVNKHCREFACLDGKYITKNESNSQFLYDLKNKTATARRQTQQTSNVKPKGIETREQTEPSSITKPNGLEGQLKLKHKLSDEFKKSESIDNLSKPYNGNNKNVNQIMMDESNGHFTKSKDKRVAIQIANTSSKLDKHKMRSVYNNIDNAHSTRSFHSLANQKRYNILDYPRNSHNRKHFKKKFPEEITLQRHKDTECKEFLLKIDDLPQVPYEERPVRKRKIKRVPENIDPDFITDIIQKQYRPVKTFGRKESDFSQFSAPVCRDKELALQDDIQEGFDVCSCYCGSCRPYKRSKPKLNDLSAMRSVCDARLYNWNKHARRKHRRTYFDVHSNADMYDFVPVKERSSPKTRRILIADNMNESCREVPPSPRTQRPQLNLEAQYCTELEDYIARANQFRRRLPHRYKEYEDVECVEQSESDCTPNLITEKMARQQKAHKYTKIRTEKIHLQEQLQTSAILNNSEFINEQTSTTDTSLNNTKETVVDKTDKALCEIKDILQSFLQELKKEAVTSECVKSDTSCKVQYIDSVLQDTINKINNPIPNNLSINNFNTGRCGINPYLAPFTNPYCYQVMPMHHINCPLENDHIPSQSCTCSNCERALKESLNTNSCQTKAETECPSKMDELIKEIYNFVALGTRKQDRDVNQNGKCEVSKTETALLTSRSVDACNMNVHDAKVGTSLKCYSQSCEAIGPKSDHNTDMCNTGTSKSFGDTFMDKVNLEATTHTSFADLDDDSVPPDKSKCNKFSRILRSFRLFKKKRKDVIEELSENESVTETKVRALKSPRKQETSNCNMHQQNCCRPPPTEAVYLRHGCERSHDYQSPQEYQTYGYEPRLQEYQPRPREFQPRPHECQIGSPKYPRPNEYQPDYHPPYNPGVREYSSPPFDDCYRQTHSLHQPPMRDHQYRLPHLNQGPTAPPYNPYDTTFSQMQPPLCLKEIEVRSTCTQSERKMSIFDKIKKKKTKRPSNYPPLDKNQRNFTQTASPKEGKKDVPQNKVKPGFSWKGLQAKAMEDKLGKKRLSSLQAYSLQTQKDLAVSNQKMKNAMIKKMFHKRNPFSPRNIVIKTLLGKDKSSFDGLPTLRKPMLFM